MPEGLYSVVVKGQVRKPGMYSASGKDNLLDIIYRDAGGMAREQLGMKAVLVGGATGRFTGDNELKAPVGHSAEIIVFDEGSCLVNVTCLLIRYNDLVLETGRSAHLLQEALREADELLTRLCSGQGTVSLLERLKQLAALAERQGHSALNPLASALRLFEREFSAHAGGRCPASICGELMLSPCANSCPANVDLPGTLALMQMGKFREALALGRSDNPLFLTCGFVCEDPPCQKNCKRLSFDDPIYSQAMHRYAGNKAVEQAGNLMQALEHPSLSAGKATDKKVAVVGAGPAGLSAAYFLARLGHKVVVYEKAPMAGGMAALGIPAYRLDKQVLAAEIQAIQALGVELLTGCTVGQDVSLSELQQTYDAVLVAVGAGLSRKLGISGESLPGVSGALDFLSAVAMTGKAAIGEKVIVIGGGNVAIDAARTAKRLGAGSVHMLSVEDRFEMPASRREIAAAVAEGITMEGLVAPLSFEGKGRIDKVVYAPVIAGPYDVTGRRWPPRLVSGQTIQRECDFVIVAIGQMPDTGFAAELLPRNSAFITHDQFATVLPGVFTAGDCATPVNTVVKAVQAGKAAAFAIDTYLIGISRTLPSPLRSQLGCFSGPYTCQTLPRAGMPEQDPVYRINNFALVEQGLAEEQAKYEMMRCICAAKGAI